MKKLNLKLGSIKEMLSKEYMKRIVGGYCCTAYCYQFNPVTEENDEVGTISIGDSCFIDGQPYWDCHDWWPGATSAGCICE